MESANIPHHLDLHDQEQQQQQLLRSASSSSSSLDASSGHGSWVGASSSNSSNHFAWSPNSSHMNVGNRIYQNINAHSYNRRPYEGQREESEEIQVPWTNNNVNNTGDNIEDDGLHRTLIPTHDHPSTKSKLELFNSLLFPKFTDMLSSTRSSVEDLQHVFPTCYMQSDHFQDLNQHDSKLLIKPALLPPSELIQSQFLQSCNFLSNTQHLSGYGEPSSSPLVPSRGTFSQIFPSVNVSNMNKSTQSNTTISGSFDMNLQALDLLSSARFGRGINHDQSQNYHLGLPKEGPYVGQQHAHQDEHRPNSNPNKLQPSLDGESTTEAKRSQSEPKTTQAPSKKLRSDSGACPPLKVRKEKLGDRISTLQQLVAPFGKTDTASVLMEAIGYIKFLQSQIETLSVPYMKSSRAQPMKPTQMMMENIDGSTESRRDLKSRGLCLVPLSYMSYVTNDGGGGCPSSEYHGAT